ncbi:MAG TPA: aminotransferase class V-fold PLP-dependent enzyme, partial [Gaiellaceae bacterium]
MYLDHAATSWPKPAVVLDAIEDFFANAGGNTGRSGHRRSIASSRAVSLARERLADLLGAESPDQVIFTKNATEALNLAICGLAVDGARIVTTSLEHNSVMRPLRYLEQHGRTVEVVRVDGNSGEIDLDEWSVRLRGAK